MSLVTSAVEFISSKNSPVQKNLLSMIIYADKRFLSLRLEREEILNTVMSAGPHTEKFNIHSK